VPLAGPTADQTAGDAVRSPSEAARPTPAATPPDLGTFGSVTDLRREVARRAAAGTLPTGRRPDVVCPPPAEIADPTLATTATVDGARREVVVRWAGAPGVAPVVVVVDPATCASTG
jgi:hypothetical protein